MIISTINGFHRVHRGELLPAHGRRARPVPELRGKTLPFYIPELRAM
jgi:hypothetical protein